MSNNWKDSRLDEIGEIISGGTPSRDNLAFWNGSIPWVTPTEITNLKGKFLLQTQEYITSEGLRNSSASLLPKQTLLITSRATIGAIAIAKCEVTTNQGFKSLVVNKNNSPLFFYYLICFIKHELIKKASGSTFEEISKRDFSSINCYHPTSIKEQEKIAEILDTIAETIAKTEECIAKLKKIKTGLVHDLLTRGIDENGEIRDPVKHPEQFKQSAIGLIPKEWDVIHLAQILHNIDAGKSPDCPDRAASNDEWGVLKVSAVHPEGFKPQENKVITNLFYVNKKYEIQNEDLLITRANTSELVGLTCLVINPPRKLMLCDKTLRLNIKKEFADVKFIVYVLQMPKIRKKIQNNATGSSAGMKNISQDIIKKILILCPKNIAEQKRISIILDNHNFLIQQEEAYLEKLKLQKKGLMHDLLTGKVRVNHLL